jgi:hypothetical protein
VRQTLAELFELCGIGRADDRADRGIAVFPDGFRDSPV